MSISFFIFSFTALLFFLFFVIKAGKNGRVVFYSVVWILIISTLSINGFFLNTKDFPPRFLIVLIGNVLWFVLCFRILKTYISSIYNDLLIHSLRIPVEVGLFFLYLENMVPKTMTFEGYNFDILTGVTAFIFLLFFYFSKTKPGKTFLLIWNTTGIILLGIIVFIAVFSAPLPFQMFAFDQPNKAVLQFPYILLPSFIVPVVLMTHIHSIYSLLSLKTQ